MSELLTLIPVAFLILVLSFLVTYGLLQLFGGPGVRP